MLHRRTDTRSESDTLHHVGAKNTYQSVLFNKPSLPDARQQALHSHRGPACHRRCRCHTPAQDVAHMSHVTLITWVRLGQVSRCTAPCPHCPPRQHLTSPGCPNVSLTYCGASPDSHEANTTWGQRRNWGQDLQLYSVLTPDCATMDPFERRMVMQPSYTDSEGNITGGRSQPEYRVYMKQLVNVNITMVTFMLILWPGQGPRASSLSPGCEGNSEHWKQRTLGEGRQAGTSRVTRGNARGHIRHHLDLIDKAFKHLAFNLSW